MTQGDPGLFAVEADARAADSFSPAPSTPAGAVDPRAPLAARMRPRSLDEVVGQHQLVREGAPLRRLVEGGSVSSMVLYGPPGTGKTTLATLVAGTIGRHFAQLSAVSAGVKEVRAVIGEARDRLRRTGEQTVLFIDEVHRFSKTQQDSLLGAVEDRTVILIAATTENPFFSVVSPLLSRSLVLQLQPLSDEDVGELLDRAVADERGLAGAVALSGEARAHLVAVAAGDGRRALTALEEAAGAVPELAASVSGGGDGSGGAAVVDLAAVERAINRAAVRYDRQGDQHYDVVSAFIKSIRGSDVDAAVHYLARMIEAGEDPRFIARRLMIHASEDVGMADPTALPLAVAAAQVVQLVGMPEARIALTQATIHLATAPKSNAVIRAIGDAMQDVQDGKAGGVPVSLRDGHYPGAARLGNAQAYVYPHDRPEAIVAQQYPPDELVGRNYYHPTRHGAERVLAERVPKLRAAVRGAADPDDDSESESEGES